VPGTRSRRQEWHAAGHPRRPIPARRAGPAGPGVAVLDGVLERVTFCNRRRRDLSALPQKALTPCREVAPERRYGGRVFRVDDKVT
jgi:hypothetical protein